MKVELIPAERVKERPPFQKGDLVTSADGKHFGIVKYTFGGSPDRVHVRWISKYTTEVMRTSEILRLYPGASVLLTQDS